MTKEQSDDEWVEAPAKPIRAKKEFTICETVDDWEEAVNDGQTPQLTDVLFDEIRARMISKSKAVPTRETLINLLDGRAFERAYKSLMFFSVMKAVSWLRGNKETHDEATVIVNWMLGWVAVSGVPVQIHKAHYGKQNPDKNGKFYWKSRTGLAHFPKVQTYYAQRIKDGKPEPYFVYDTSCMEDKEDKHMIITVSFSPKDFGEKTTWHGFHVIPKKEE
jgi:hypothetical protein